MESPEYHFYHLVFRRIREEDFAVLYAENEGRPNAPINVMVSAMLLQQHRHWTYEELFEQMAFNLKTRVALGQFTLDEQVLCPASLFNFQNRLRAYGVETGINLMEKVFDQFTSDQLKQLKVKTSIQRSDSTLVGSNIRTYSRLQLLVEVLERLHRVLTEKDQADYRERFAPYVGQSSGQYIYRLRSSEYGTALSTIGAMYHWVIKTLQASYGTLEVWTIVDRVYTEHFTVVEKTITVKPSEELSSDILQSPDDVEATYRKKHQEGHRGYVVHVSETAHAENGVNLITDIVVEQNNVDDSVLLEERLPVMREKTPELKELHTDGGYASEQNDEKLAEAKIAHIATAIRGRAAGVNMTIDETGEQQYVVTCPQQQKTESGRVRKRFKAVFAATSCAMCPLAKACPTVIQRGGTRVYYFTEAQYRLSVRRRALASLPAKRQHLRANVEATIQQLKRFTRNGKVRLRGLFRVTLFAWSATLMINFGRIFRMKDFLLNFIEHWVRWMVMERLRLLVTRTSVVCLTHNPPTAGVANMRSLYFMAV